MSGSDSVKMSSGNLFICRPDSEARIAGDHPDISPSAQPQRLTRTGARRQNAPMLRYSRLIAVLALLAALLAVAHFSGLKAQFTLQLIHDHFVSHPIMGL